MNKLIAIEVKRESLLAVESLSRALNHARSGYSENEFAALHQEIGILIGRIQMGVLEPIYIAFTDLDDLA
jgi:hypothetical protein